MSRVEGLNLEVFHGGSIGTDRVKIPNSIDGTCSVCGRIFGARLPHGLTIKNGALGFGVACPSCHAMNRFFVVYSESGDPKEPAEVFQHVHWSREYSDGLRALLEKAFDRFQSEDYSGVITLCYTLAERSLKSEMLARGYDFKNSEGDIRVLSKCYLAGCGTLPSENSPKQLNAFLNSVLAVVSHLYEISNKGGDRHDEVISIDRASARFVLESTQSVLRLLLLGPWRNT